MLTSCRGERDELRGRCEPVGVQHAGVTQAAETGTGTETINKVTEHKMLSSNPVCRIRRSRRIRHEIRRTGLRQLSGLRKAVWHTLAGPHPASYNKQPLTMLFDVFQQYPAAMPILEPLKVIIGSFLNVVIWRYPIMLRQQMAEFHGEMPSAQSKISLALPRSHCPHCQQTIRIREYSAALLADAQRALP